MTDEGFARAFEAGRIAPADFCHLSHLRLGWAYLRESSLEQAVPRMREAIRRFAAAAGAGQKYHDTITVAWMRLLDQVKAGGATGELADVLRTHPELADRDLPLRYYSPDRLFSDQARANWIEPDLRPLDER